MKAYPRVISEFDTMSAVVAGASLSRYGDGELRQADRVVGIKPQVANAALTARLRAILLDSGQCLVGIPNIHDGGPKSAHWNTYLWAAKLLADRPYASAFVTRPDSAPWINDEAYWTLVQSLWLGKTVTLVRGQEKSFTADELMLAGAASVREVLCPVRDAWVEYDDILERIGTPDHSVLLCLGPTATVLAVDLCAKGVHAVDLGHLGMFWKKRLRGLPMWVTPTDKALA